MGSAVGTIAGVVGVALVAAPVCDNALAATGATIGLKWAEFTTPNDYQPYGTDNLESLAGANCDKNTHDEVVKCAGVNGKSKEPSADIAEEKDDATNGTDSGKKQAQSNKTGSKGFHCRTTILGP